MVELSRGIERPAGVQVVTDRVSSVGLYGSLQRGHLDPCLLINVIHLIISFWRICHHPI
jgi:hypothetical protein